MSAERAVKRLRKRAADFHHGDLRAAAVVAGVQEVEQHGRAGFSLEKIAKRLGVTRPALYRHFEDKDALLAEVAHVGWTRFETRLFECVTRDASTWERLYAMARAYVEFARDNPAWFFLQFKYPVRGKPDFDRAPPRYAPLALQALERELPPDEALAAYRGLWGMAHGLAVLVVEGAPVPFEPSLRQYVQSLQGLAAQRRR